MKFQRGAVLFHANLLPVSDPRSGEGRGRRLFTANRVSRIVCVGVTSLALSVGVGHKAHAEIVARHFGASSPTSHGWTETQEASDGAPLGIGGVVDSATGQQVAVWQLDTLSNGDSLTGGPDVRSDEVSYKVHLGEEQLDWILSTGWSFSAVFRPIAVDPDADTIVVASFKIEELANNQITFYPIRIKSEAGEFSVQFDAGESFYPIADDAYTTVSIQDLDADGLADVYLDGVLRQSGLAPVLSGGSFASAVEFGDPAGGSIGGNPTPEMIVNYREVSLLVGEAPECGNGVVEGVECCDLGEANGTGFGCTSACGCEGVCTDQTMLACAAASMCDPGAGCCGNGILEGDEQCDDSNLESGDCCSSSCQIEADSQCTPACPDVSGPQLLSAADVRVRLVDRDSDGLYEKWTTRPKGRRGDFNLRAGQQVDPTAEDTSVTFIQNDPTSPGTARVLGSYTISPTDWKRCTERPPGSGDEKCVFRDSTEMLLDPDGLRVGFVKEKGAKIRFKFKGTRLAAIEAPDLATLNDKVRICVRIGDDAGSALLTCQEKGKRLLCDSE